MNNSDEKALDEAYKPLNTAPKLPWVMKTEGENGVRALHEGRLMARETIAKWSAELRAMRLIRLADLLDSIAETMPPRKAMPPSAHVVDLDAEQAWAEWLAEHPEHMPFEAARQAERAAWRSARGLA
jgi:hypothetical protein